MKKYACTVGIFDSGIGGLTVLKECLAVAPACRYLYYGDNLRAPYGERSPEEILSFVREALKKFKRRRVDAVVIACNTATSVAITTLREKYDLPIIGMEPAVKKALDENDTMRVLVCATPITVRGKKLKQLIERVDNHHLVDLLPLPQLVRFAETGEFDSKAVTSYLSEELSRFDLTKESSLVLGCTHFNYFKDSFRKLLPDSVKFVDGNEGTVNQLYRKLQENGLLENNRQSIEFYYSKEKVTDEAELKRIDSLFERLDKMFDLK